VRAERVSEVGFTLNPSATKVLTNHALWLTPRRIAREAGSHRSYERSIDAAQHATEVAHRDLANSLRVRRDRRREVGLPLGYRRQFNAPESAPLVVGGRCPRSSPI
jgi:hypothetical protein